MMSGSLLTIILPLCVLFLVVPVYVASQYGRAGRPRPEFNYPILRTVVGVIALCIASLSVLATEHGVVIDSISASYHTDGHDVFVGLLLVVSAFLLAYQGREFEGDRLASWNRTEFVCAKIGSICVALTALVPTSDCPFTVSQCASNVPEYVGMTLDQSGYWHAWFAGLFFTSLAIILFTFVWRAWQRGTLWSRIRALTYAVCMCGMIYAVAVFAFADIERKVFVAEAIALASFGAGWILAGVYDWFGDTE
ncbi:MAG: hypothetical protein AAF525_05450 [Pseudomonadota bacterium]